MIIRSTVLLSLLLLAGCGQSEQKTDDPVLAEGRRAFTDRGCITCHGKQAEGTRMGPALEDLSRHYDVSRLIEYLKNPDAMIKEDERLSAQAEDYVGMMPRFDYLSPEELEALARYALSLD
ncbi:MAG: cytochrome c [Bacteroidetes bacterium]|nr:cytochrome c [Bacteroidota bacterium]